MNKLFALPAAAALCLANSGSCSHVNTLPPAPLASTAADEQALNIAYEAFNTLLTAVDAIHLERNSPKALQVQHLLIVARDALNAAASAERAGNATTYAAAITNAQAAFASVRAAIQE